MKITILTVGKIKEKYIQNGIDEYIKRLSKFTKIEIIEVADEKCAERLSESEMEIVKHKEGDRLIQKLPDSAYTVTLEINGDMISSEDLAGLISKSQLNGYSHICFIIGGSLGLDIRVTARSNYRLSFSKMTFPHQLMRLILLEQIYRGFKINGNEPYHK